MCALAVVTSPPHLAMTHADAGYYMASEKNVVKGNRIPQAAGIANDFTRCDFL
jgi:hypothetical protein